MLGLSQTTWAVGLGNLRVQSPLGAVLRAEIDLLQLSTEELSTLSVRIPGAAMHKQQGLDYPAALADLQINIASDGRAMLLLTSRSPVSEPLMEVLVDLRWDKGHLIRQYTLLLDPPELSSANNALRFTRSDVLVARPALAPVAAAPLGAETPLKPAPVPATSARNTLGTAAVDSKAKPQGALVKAGGVNANEVKTAQESAKQAKTKPVAEKSPRKDKQVQSLKRTASAASGPASVSSRPAANLNLSFSTQLMPPVSGANAQAPVMQAPSKRLGAERAAPNATRDRMTVSASSTRGGVIGGAGNSGASSIGGVSGNSGISGNSGNSVSGVSSNSAPGVNQNSPVGSQQPSDYKAQELAVWRTMLGLKPLAQSSALAPAPAPAANTANSNITNPSAANSNTANSNTANSASPSPASSNSTNTGAVNASALNPVTNAALGISPPSRDLSNPMLAAPARAETAALPSASPALASTGSMELWEHSTSWYGLLAALLGLVLLGALWLRARSQSKSRAGGTGEPQRDVAQKRSGPEYDFTHSFLDTTHKPQVKTYTKGLGGDMQAQTQLMASSALLQMMKIYVHKADWARVKSLHAEISSYSKLGSPDRAEADALLAKAVTSENVDTIPTLNKNQDLDKQGLDKQDLDKQGSENQGLKATFNRTINTDQTPLSPHSQSVHTLTEITVDFEDKAASAASLTKPKIKKQTTPSLKTNLDVPRSSLGIKGDLRTDSVTSDTVILKLNQLLEPQFTVNAVPLAMQALPDDTGVAAALDIGFKGLDFNTQLPTQSLSTVLSAKPSSEGIAALGASAGATDDGAVIPLSAAVSGKKNPVLTASEADSSLDFQITASGKYTKNATPPKPVLSTHGAARNKIALAPALDLDKDTISPTDTDSVANANNTKRTQSTNDDTKTLGLIKAYMDIGDAEAAKTLLQTMLEAKPVKK